ncbi:RNA chaperone ProQ [Pasteurellaceae bacterium RH1A]|nr:RNA chaperone ProQ [Pasteurellaceae bacterium RH1A]
MSEQEQQITTEAENTKTSMTSKEAIAYLVQKFPLCFSLEGEAKPLKIGLFQDLATALENEDISKTTLRQALRVYTMGWRYLAACQADAVRVDLEGNPAGVVDAQQAEHAAQSLAEAKAAYAQRREEQRKAERKAFFKKKAREEKAQARPAHKAKKPAPQKAAENLTALDSSKVVKGQAVKVLVGSQSQAATILDVEKQGVRVQLATGLTVTVSQDRLFA